MTIPTVMAICAAVQNIMGELTGVRSAPDVPPDQVGPSGVKVYCYPGTGEYKLVTVGRAGAQHVLHLQVLTAKSDLRSNYNLLVPFGHSVPLALLGNITVSGTVLMINAVRYAHFGGVESWAGEDMFGWLFELDVSAAGTLS